MNTEKMAAMVEQLERDIEKAHQEADKAQEDVMEAYMIGFHYRDREVRALRAEVARLQALLTNGE